MFVDADGNEIKVIQADDISAELLSWSPDGNYIASIGQEQKLKIWDYATGTMLYSQELHRETMLWGLDWSPDGQYIYYTDNESVPLRLSVAELVLNQQGQTG